jgi:hypothetical protein
MARSAIPDFGTEYPEWKYRPWPKYAGLDEAGDALIAENEEEFRRFKELAVYPKVLGNDKFGNEIIAQNPRDEQWLKNKVIKAAIDAAEPVNELTGEVPAKRPYNRKAVA